MGKSYRAFPPETNLGIDLAGWLRRLAADHDGPALVVAKAVGSLMFEDGPGMWFKLSRISYLTGLSPDMITGILHWLRRRHPLQFERRDDRLDDISARAVTPTDRHACGPTPTKNEQRRERPGSSPASRSAPRSSPQPRSRPHPPQNKARAGNDSAGSKHLRLRHRK
jgi:hypothetical protein